MLESMLERTCYFQFGNAARWCVRKEVQRLRNDDVCSFKTDGWKADAAMLLSHKTSPHEPILNASNKHLFVRPYLPIKLDSQPLAQCLSIQVDRTEEREQAGRTANSKGERNAGKEAQRTGGRQMH